MTTSVVWRRRAARAGLVLALGIVTAPAPSQRSRGQSVPSEATVLGGFDLRRGAARRTALPRGLREISGLAVTADGRVFAHDDERGVVSQIDPCHGSIIKSFSLGRPPLREDFEGIAIAGERFFLVTSGGRLYETREGGNGAVVTFRTIDTGFGRSCELEGMAFEPTDRVLLIGCKRPLRGTSRGTVTIFRWSLDRGAPAVPPAITIALGATFHVSSIERHARTGHYVLVAGPQRTLAEISQRRALVVHRLEQGLHAQPEGVTFVGDSLLVVADEGGTGPATLTCYRRTR